MAEKHRTAKLLDTARKALAQGDKDLAIDRSEAAVRELPGNADGRMLLGRSYLAAGRFGSADLAFGDALTLDPTLTRAAINRALAQIALGNKAGALASLDRAAAAGNEADVGLALALLDEVDRARSLLETAAHMPGAAPRLRQNLALVYAMQGRWNDAAVVAAQDVPADQLAERLRRWATIMQLKDQPAMLVGALLGVLPGNDPGQPAALALIPPVPMTPVRADAAAEAVLPTAVEGPAIAPPSVAEAVSAATPEAHDAAFSGPQHMRDARGAARRVKIQEVKAARIVAASRRPGNLIRPGTSRFLALAARHSAAKVALRLANSCIAAAQKFSLGRMYRIAVDGSPVIPDTVRHCAKGQHCPARVTSRSYRPMHSSRPTIA